jgi:hypothetical protein
MFKHVINPIFDSVAQVAVMISVPRHVRAGVPRGAVCPPDTM